jgi:hypothetical protein
MCGRWQCGREGGRAVTHGAKHPPIAEQAFDPQQSTDSRPEEDGRQVQGRLEGREEVTCDQPRPGGSDHTPPPGRGSFTSAR